MAEEEEQGGKEEQEGSSLEGNPLEKGYSALIASRQRRPGLADNG